MRQLVDRLNRDPRFVPPGAASLIFIVLFFVVFFVRYGSLGTYITTYECPGVLNKTTPTKLFIIIKQNSEWAFWAFSEPYSGREALRMETPSTTIPIRNQTFGLKRVGTYLDLYQWPDADHATYTLPTGEQVFDMNDLPKLHRGQFSLISNALVLNISDTETFSGICTPKNN